MLKIQNDIYRLNDVYFKSLMGNPHHKNLTLNFLNAILNRSHKNKFVDLDFKDKELIPKASKEKMPALDILAIMNDGTQVNIEVQVAAQDFYIRRAIYYCSKLHGSQLHRGDGYIQIRPTISIHLMDFKFFNDDRYHRKIYLKDDDTNAILSEDISFHFVELPKITFRDIRKIRGAKAWFAYFSKNCTNTDREVVAMNNPAIKDAVNFENLFFADDKLRHQYDLSEKYRNDYISSIDYALKKGEQRGERRGKTEGRTEGIAEHAKQTAEKMLNDNMPIDLIAKYSGLSIQEIENLK